MSNSERDGGPSLWREEFSFESADERYISRRQFLKFLSLTSLAMLVGNLVILARSRFGRAAASPTMVIARIDEIPVGGVKLFRYPTAKDPCLLVRVAADEFAAYSQTCTHLSCPVYYSATSNQLECPCHHGAFSVDDGRVLYGPPQRPLPTILVERRGENLVASGVRVEEVR